MGEAYIVAAARTAGDARAARSRAGTRPIWEASSWTP